MSTERKLPLRLVRFKDFLAVLARNRLSLAGLVLLFSFVFLALAGPLLTPYNPIGDEVAAPFSPPAWITLITGDYGTSGNAEFSGLSASGIGDVQVQVSGVGKDSIDFHVVSGGNGGSVAVVKTLSYQYSGPPGRFGGNVAVKPLNLPAGVTAGAEVRVDRASEGGFSFWDQVLDANTEYRPSSSFSSFDTGLRDRFGFGNQIVSLPEVIFDRKDNYTLRLEIALPQVPFQADFQVRDFRLFLYGNIWGLMGTDNAGRDVFSQLAHGARLSLVVGLVATLIGIAVGLLVGLMAGYLGKVVDEVLMRFTDMMLVIPGLPLLIVLVAVLGASLLNIILVLGFLGWMGFARLVRSQVLSIRERPFVEAAKASGAGTGYITLKHIFPNIVGLTYVNLALSVPGAIVGEAALSFLGLGDQTTITWGRMLELVRESGSTASTILWWWIVPPGLSIALLSLSFILLGYALDDIFNPKLRKRR